MNHLSLFSGIGGIDLAAEWAGMKTVAFVEQNKFCQKVLAKHWPHVPIFDDVKTISAKDIHEPIDIISGGFPCQPFSKAGNRMGAEDDRHLWPEYLRLIQELRPRWIVGENVAGIITMALDDVLADLEAHGYTSRAFNLPACSVGAHHRRERVFIVAHADGERLLYGKHEIKPAEAWLHAFSDIGTSGKSLSNSSRFRLQRSRQVGIGKYQGQFNHVWEKTAGSSGCKIPNRHSWDYEPCMGRMVDGVPDRMDRIKSLGNAVVPQQIYPIMKAIMDIERATA